MQLKSKRETEGKKKKREEKNKKRKNKAEFLSVCFLQLRCYAKAFRPIKETQAPTHTPALTIYHTAFQ